MTFAFPSIYSTAKKVKSRRHPRAQHNRAHPIQWIQNRKEFCEADRGWHIEEGRDGMSADRGWYIEEGRDGMSMTYSYIVYVVSYLVSDLSVQASSSFPYLFYSIPFYSIPFYAGDDSRVRRLD